MMKMLEKRNRSYVISYRTQRRLVGILGMILPLVCFLGGWLFTGIGRQESISYYYHTNMRDWFVALMGAVGMFLLTYHGKYLIDDLVSSASGIAALMVAFFPCRQILPPLSLHPPVRPGLPPIGMFYLDQNISQNIHAAAAASFFILLACNSLFLFTRSRHPKDQLPRPKVLRNRVYRVCGVIILAALALLGTLVVVMDPLELSNSGMIFWLEAVMLAAFGVSWLVKGETLFRDRAVV